MTVKDQLDASCEEALEFPKNLLRHNTYEHSIDSYHERLNEHEGRLFHNEAQAAVDFSEFAVQGKGMFISGDHSGQKAAGSQKLSKTRGSAMQIRVRKAMVFRQRSLPDTLSQFRSRS